MVKIRLCKQAKNVALRERAISEVFCLDRVFRCLFWRTETANSSFVFNHRVSDGMRFYFFFTPAAASTAAAVAGTAAVAALFLPAPPLSPPPSPPPPSHVFCLLFVLGIPKKHGVFSQDNITEIPAWTVESLVLNSFGATKRPSQKREHRNSR